MTLAIRYKIQGRNVYIPVDNRSAEKVRMKQYWLQFFNLVQRSSVSVNFCECVEKVASTWNNITQILV